MMFSGKLHMLPLFLSSSKRLLVYIIDEPMAAIPSAVALTKAKIKENSDVVGVDTL